MRYLNLSKIADSSQGDFSSGTRGGLGRRLFMKRVSFLGAALALVAQTLMAKTEGKAKDLLGKTDFAREHASIAATAARRFEISR